MITNLSKSRLLAFTLMVAGCGAVTAQTSVPFTATVDVGQGATPFVNNGTVTLSADSVGSSTSARITILYRGSSTFTITNADRTGSTDFSVITPALPIALGPNQTADLTIRYLPKSASKTSARLTLFYSEGSSSGTFAVNLVGQAPDLLFSYIFAGGNTVSVPAGGTVPFPLTRIGSPTSLTFSILNRGAAPAMVGSIATTGNDFAVSGLPLPPITVDAGRDFRFSVTFSPTASSQLAGTLRIDFTGRSVTFGLLGNGTGPAYAYEMATASGVTPIAAGQTVTVADTTVGERTTVTIRVTNAGNADGTISSINILGTGYQLGDLPFFPLTLASGQTVSFVVTFAPTAPGRSVGRLRVGSDNFDLVSTALGPSLTFSYSINGVSAPIQNNGTLLFSPAQVGSSTTAKFVVQNSGTTGAAINNIVVSSTAAFSVTNLPALPLTLAVNDTISFDVVFAPKTLAVATTTMQVGNQTFTLSGTGTPPPPLPEIQIQGSTSEGVPLDQPAYSVTLASGYPLNLTGTLTIGFNSEVFANDPSVQWVSGGRTVAFTVPANTTRAVFPNNANQIRLQTGSTAGTISVSSSFSTASGVNVTPANPPVATLAIRKSAPQIVSAQLASKTANSFALQITGYATGRSVSQVDMRVTAASGENVSNSSLTMNASSAFLAWYQGTQSQQYGSLFTATVTISIEGSVRAGSTLVDAIQSVSLTITNAEGTSNAQTVNLK